MIEAKAAAGIEVTIVGSPVGYGTMVPVEGMDNFDQPLGPPAVVPRLAVRDRGRARPAPARLRLHQPVRRRGHALADRRHRARWQLRGADREHQRARRVPRLSSSRRRSSTWRRSWTCRCSSTRRPSRWAATSYTAFPLVEQVARFSDVTACLATLVFSGRLERHPRPAGAGCDGGRARSGCSAERLDTAHGMRMRGGPPGGGPPPAAGAQRHRPPSEQLRRIYVDTATSSRHSLEADLAVLGRRPHDVRHRLAADQQAARRLASGRARARDLRRPSGRPCSGARRRSCSVSGLVPRLAHHLELHCWRARPSGSVGLAARVTLSEEGRDESIPRPVGPSMSSWAASSRPR